MSLAFHSIPLVVLPIRYNFTTRPVLTPSTAPIFEVRLNQNFVENLPRKNTTITTFHAVSKEGTGHFTDFPNFCYRGCFFVSFKPSRNERGGMPGGAVHMHDNEKARN
jgi:hypothetical protein